MLSHTSCELASLTGEGIVVIVILVLIIIIIILARLTTNICFFDLHLSTRIIFHLYPEYYYVIASYRSCGSCHYEVHQQ